MDANTQVAQVSALFDTVADDYDNTGVAFFGPIAAHLIEHVAPRPGERALDLGCGSGVVTTRLASAVGQSGSVVALDSSAAMVDRAAALTEGMPNVTVVQGDAMDPHVDGDLDIVTASLVIFFLPDPWVALKRWLALLRPGGRVALTTFGASAAAWQQAEALLRPHMPPSDPRVIGPKSPFGSDAGVETFLRDAGAEAVTTASIRVPVAFDDIDHWVRWSRSVGQRAAWDRMPADEVDRVIAAATESLEAARGEDGHYHVWQDVRCTIGYCPSGR